MDAENQLAALRTGYVADDVLVWAPAKPGLLARQRRGLLGDEDEEGDDPE
jgi:hypothetical protein